MRDRYFGPSNGSVHRFYFHDDAITSLRSLKNFFRKAPRVALRATICQKLGTN